MKRLFRIDLTSIPTQEERYKILELFPSSWEIYEHWDNTDVSHIILDYFEAFWFPSSSEPVLPPLPDHVIVTAIS